MARDLTDERVREIAGQLIWKNEKAMGVDEMRQELRQRRREAVLLASDWLVLTAKATAYRALAEEAMDRGCCNKDCEHPDCVDFRARLAALEADNG